MENEPFLRNDSVHDTPELVGVGSIHLSGKR
jgi:hypothetical protein